jgi:hypothetical protein
MTVITRRPENRLATMVFKPGGKQIAQAIDDAQAGIDEIRIAELDVLRVKLEEIQKLGRKAEKSATNAQIEDLYSLSVQVLDISGMYGLVELGQAAFSLCELLDRLRARQVWNWPAVQVHLHGLLILADPDKVPESGRQSVVEGLRAVCERVSR